MTRRTFLQTALATTATVGAGSASGAAAELPASGRRVPIGFLGATYSHGPDKIRLTRSSPDWDLVGVCDESAAGRAVCEQLGVPRISREELFRRAEVVAVESDIRDHEAHGLLALQAGRHVHLEKPPAATMAGMRALVTAAREQGKLLQTGFMWRFNPGFRAVFEAVRNGWLGEVVLVRAFMGNHLAPDRRPEWAEFHGGSMFEQGSHLVDAVVRLLGAPRKVTPFLRHQGAFKDTLNDANVAVLEFDKATAVITNTALQAASSPQRSFEVTGTLGTAVLQPIEPPTLIMDLSRAAGPYSKGAQKVPLPSYTRYEDEFRELAAAVRGQGTLSVPLEEELLVGETVLRVCQMQ
ncbi:MAG: Gfo/Idh/MocA family oxidoreductase [Verrucomicrobia bacterium]|nr:Gfo/Idh/MocA family oxidoreductase [Verrucomicrobiota bacterium]